MVARLKLHTKKQGRTAFTKTDYDIDDVKMLTHILLFPIFTVHFTRDRDR